MDSKHKSGIGPGLRLSRRGALGLIGLGGAAAACQPKAEKHSNAGLSLSGQEDTAIFAHGIASGEPDATSIVLWSRISMNAGIAAAGPVHVHVLIGETEDLSDAQTYKALAKAERDYCVKVIAQNLKPGTRYFYRFDVPGQDRTAQSQLGRTKTLPVGETDSARFAVMSCANYEHGYFNVYDLIAQRADRYDALIHLGDYYYEYPAGQYTAPNAPEDRVHEPAGEILTRADYRARHSIYRRDPALQAMTAQIPLFPIWDDHETSNDSWQGGAENHQDGEGPWATRMEAALGAYAEWMPIREAWMESGKPAHERYSAHQFGDLLTLVAVETRLTARAEPLILENHIDEIEADPDRFKSDVLGDPTRQMFGEAQRDFIVGALAQSKADGTLWRLMANQVIMGRLLTPDFSPYLDPETTKVISKDWPGIYDFLKLSKHNMPVYPDSWDGYPVAREAFYAALDEADVRDLVVLTGDAHEFWLNELTRENGTKIGMELVTSSVSSKTLTAYLGSGTEDHNLLLTRENADARYYNALHNGYLDVDVRRDHIDVRMVAVDTVSSRDYGSFNAAEFRLTRKDGTVKSGRPKGLNVKQRALYHGLG